MASGVLACKVSVSSGLTWKSMYEKPIRAFFVLIDRIITDKPKGGTKFFHRSAWEAYCSFWCDESVCDNSPNPFREEAIAYPSLTDTRLHADTFHSSLANRLRKPYQTFVPLPCLRLTSPSHVVLPSFSSSPYPIRPRPRTSRIVRKLRTYYHVYDIRVPSIVAIAIARAQDLDLN
jgi:hypothetical protein